jgi:hypothetical protein
MRSLWVFATAAVCVALAGSSVVFSGCSSSSGAQQATDGGGDDMTGTDVVAPDVVDAGPDIDQPPGVYPANHQPIPQIDYLGGPIYTNPRIVTITFVGDPHRDGLRGLDHYMTMTDWWQQTAESYCTSEAGPCVGPGVVTAPDGSAWLPDGSTEDAGDGYLDVELPFDFPSMTVPDSTIGPWLDKHIGNGDFPKPDSQTVYVIYFPANVTLTDQDGPSCLSYNAYHTAYHSKAAGNALTSYAVIPYCDFGQGDMFNYTQVQVSASHEIAETATDPFPGVNMAFFLVTNDAWVGAQSLGGGECGDMCEGLSNANWPDTPYTYQRLWSNQAAALSQQPCQPSASPNPYFALALRTKSIPINGHTSAGYIVAKRGQSTVGIADAFSELALGHDFALYAGKNKGYRTTTPSDLDVPDDGITIAFSKLQVHNGNGVYVTFTVPSNATPTDVHVVLRAVYESDYNDWPVIVHVE